MAQFAAAPRQPGGSAFAFAVGAGGLAPLQLRHRAEHSHQQGPGPGVAQHTENLLAPGTVLEEVIDDEVGAHSQVLPPTSVNAGQQGPGVGTQDQPDPGGAVRRALVEVFPGGEAVVWLPGDQAPEVAAVQCDEADRKEGVGDQGDDVVEGHPGEDRRRIAVGQCGQTLLQRPAQRRLTRGTGPVDQNRHRRIACHGRPNLLRRIPIRYSAAATTNPLNQA